MNAKDLYIRRQYFARRGFNWKRRGTFMAELIKHKRELVPKHAKWGDFQAWHRGAVQKGMETFSNQVRRDYHLEEKKKSRLNKNFRRRQNPMKDRRKYWKKERDKL